MKKKCQMNGKHDQQYRQSILQVSSSKHNARKITRVRGPFHQSITAILTEEKKRRGAVH